MKDVNSGNWVWGNSVITFFLSKSILKNKVSINLIGETRKMKQRKEYNIICTVSHIIYSIIKLMNKPNQTEANK